MEALAETKSVYLREHEALPSDRPAWLEALHRRGIEDFEAVGFPNRRQEAWRKTDLSQITDAHYRAVSKPGAVGAELSNSVGATGPGYRLVFVDGRLDRSLSDLEDLPAGLTVASLAEYGADAPERLTGVLGRLADTAANPFAALNTAFFRDGAFVHVARGAAIERPVVLVHVATAREEPHAIYPRTVVQVEEGAEVKLVERFIGADEVPALIAPVTELHAAQGAIVSYYRLQEEGSATRHLGVVHARAERDASVRMHSMSAGGRLARVDIHADIADEGAEVLLDGLYLTAGRQFSDHHTWVNHRTPHGTSRQNFRGVLQGRSETVFDGLVKVFKDAQKTDAQQQNRNLVLDRMALAHSNPRLEIYADDVKCAHGSTVGELEEDALFYLRSRGIAPDEARGLLTMAFASEVLEGIRVAEVRDHMMRVLLRYLPGDTAIEELE